MPLLTSAMMPYVAWFAVLLAICVAVFVRNRQTSKVVVTADFRSFQRSFLIVYLIMMMADWMQGPYVYALYDQYGFSMAEIGVLFIVGFGSSMLFGTFVGSLADRYGRRFNCLIFTVLYSISCATKHFPDFNVLLFGRLLGGISTSILASAFETWMIHQHHKGAFPEEWLSNTFSHMTFGSGLVAILAGLVASPLAAYYGPVAPFDASLVLLVAGGAFIYFTWPENYGDARTDAFGFANFRQAWSLLWSNEKVLLLGLIQSCFESAMFVFVFMWTPSLEATLAERLASSSTAASTAAGADPSTLSSRTTEKASADAALTLPHGLVFAGFMVCVMIGSKIFETLTEWRPVEHFSRIVFVVSTLALAVPVLLPSHFVNLLAFCVFEICCGLYFPAIGTLRSKYIPEEIRSTVMNVFRVGLNLIVVSVLANIGNLSEDAVFMLCCLLLSAATLCQHRLFILSESNSSAAERARVGLEVGQEMDDVLASKEDASA